MNPLNMTIIGVFTDETYHVENEYKVAFHQVSYSTLTFKFDQ